MTRRRDLASRWPWTLGGAVCLTVACGPQRTPHQPQEQPGPQPPTAESQFEGVLTDRINELVAPYRGVAGVSFEVIETQQDYQLRGAQPFPMASTYKFPVALAWLHRVDQGMASLEQNFEVLPEDLAPYHSPLADEAPTGGVYPLRALLRRMVEQSDNTACDVLLNALGGPSVVNANLQRLGVVGIRVDRTERQLAVDLLRAARKDAITATDRSSLMRLDQSLSSEEREAARSEFQDDPRDRATPLSMVQLLVQFHRGRALSPASTALLRESMTRSQSRIGLKLPSETVVANKTGTGLGSFNDVGIVALPDGRHLALAIYVSRLEGISWDAGNELVADIAKVAYDAVL